MEIDWTQPNSIRKMTWSENDQNLQKYLPVKFQNKERNRGNETREKKMEEKAKITRRKILKESGKKKVFQMIWSAGKWIEKLA